MTGGNALLAVQKNGRRARAGNLETKVVRRCRKPLFYGGGDVNPDKLISRSCCCRPHCGARRRLRSRRNRPFGPCRGHPGDLYRPRNTDPVYKQKEAGAGHGRSRQAGRQIGKAEVNERPRRPTRLQIRKTSEVGRGVSAVDISVIRRRKNLRGEGSAKREPADQEMPPPA